MSKYLYYISLISQKMKQHYLCKVIERLMELPQKSTIQLFHNDKPNWEDSPIEPIGSGVLFELNEEYYIITAAHVVQGYATKKPINPYKDEDDYDDPSQAYLSLENIGFLYNEAYYPIQRAVFTTVVFASRYNQYVIY